MKSRVMLFSASWCGSCKRVKPMVMQMCKAEDYVLDIVDVDSRPDIAERYGVSSLPTLLKVDMENNVIDGLTDIDREKLEEFLS